MQDREVVWRWLFCSLEVALLEHYRSVGALDTRRKPESDRIPVLWTQHLPVRAADQRAKCRQQWHIAFHKLHLRHTPAALQVEQDGV